LGGNPSGSCPDYENTNNWYLLYDLCRGSYEKERMYTYVFPINALGSTIYSVTSDWTDARFEDYIYFDKDASGSGATFVEGQYLQFLHNVIISCTGNPIRFYGTDSDNSYMFTRGDKSKGIRVYDGCVKLFEGGQLTLRGEL
jgi:hypothetical protein